jgi:glycosyltransferase involved in cell wall biosynthesis
VKNVTLIPYGVATPALPMLEPKPLGQPVELIVVSRLAPNKRIDHALRALRLVRDRGLKARLTVVGSGGEETRLRQIVAEERLGDVVQFTGALREAEKDQRLREAHFLLHTSQREGWGLNVIEANAMGTPAIVYPVAGLIESTLHNQTGLVSGAETPEALADSVQAAMAAPERYPAFRRQAWERAKTFHWDAVLPQACDWLERKAKGAA